MARWWSSRLDRLPPYLFVDIDRKRRAAIAAGKDVINLGIGDPDTPTPEFIVQAMERALHDPANHRYPVGAGNATFRKACAEFVRRRFNVKLDESSHFTSVIGTKEGIGHLPSAVIDPGDVVLIPDPGYPVYQAGTIFAGGMPHVVPLRAEDNWLPRFEEIPSDVVSKAKLIFLNYPNNPTGAVANRSFYNRAIEFAKRHDILIAHDAAYADVYMDERPPSILEFDGALDCCIEFYSLSKTFNMTGWRIGFAMGHPTPIAALARFKDNVDSGPFSAIQHAAATALNQYDHVSVQAMRDIYRQRRDVVVNGLSAIGLDPPLPTATFYVWCRCPRGYSSLDFVGRVLEEAAVVVIPGNGFGPGGDGFFRIALTVGLERLTEAMERIGRIQW